MNPKSPQYQQSEEYQNRLSKLKEIKELNIEAYPHIFETTNYPNEILEKWKNQEVGLFEDAASGATDEVKVAGRLILFRAMGKNAFGHVQDHTGRIQFICNRDLTKVEGLLENAPITPIKFIEKKIDLGDIIGIEGNLFRTQKGELTIFVKKLTLLCKALLPLPDKHGGLNDIETRYRKRWIDLIANKEVCDQMRMRSKILTFIRKYMDDAGFLEVETPVLQNTYGGANAKPFKTHINALDIEMFLRISLEIPLKKLIVGGMNKVYEMGKVFRNEDIDRTHNPEFTELEGYAAYWDYNQLMSFVENIYEALALELFGDTKIRLQLKDEDTAEVIDLKTPWKRLTMKGSILEYAKIDVDKLSDEELRDILLKQTKLDKDDIKKAARGYLIAYLFEEFVEHHLIEPHHITDHPIETTPLCKMLRDHKNQKEVLIERFESFILGREMSNAYTEANDPIYQRKLLEEQATKKASGDETAHPLDEEFIESICQGMPPTAGFGLGIDRLVMLLTNASSIRDVIYFPIMKPEK